MIIDKPFTPENGQCALCTAEEKIIIYNPESATLNTRNELGARCKHTIQTRLQKNKIERQDLDQDLDQKLIQIIMFILLPSV